MNPNVRDPLETPARAALQVMGNHAYQPNTGQAPNEFNSAVTVDSPPHADGGSTYPFALDSSPLDDDHYYLV